MQNFSIELSKKLSELVPDIGEHAYDWVVQEGNNGIGCTEHLHRQIICPAWQVEDLLRNVDRLFPVMERGNAAYWIADHLRGTSLDATYAYQKIEEYLWKILK